MQIIRASHIDGEVLAHLEKKYFSQPWSQKSIEDAIQRQDTIYLVAKIENQVVGYLGLWWSYEEGELVRIVVEKDYRRMRIARSLMDYLFDLLTQQGIEKIFLEVRQSNQGAIAFYEQLGFRIVGIRKNYYSDPKEDGMAMLLNLKSGLLGEDLC